MCVLGVRDVGCEIVEKEVLKEKGNGKREEKKGRKGGVEGWTGDR